MANRPESVQDYNLWEFSVADEEVAAIVGVGRKTIDDWEKNITIGETAISYNVPDLGLAVMPLLPVMNKYIKI